MAELDRILGEAAGDASADAGRDQDVGRSRGARHRPAAHPFRHAGRRDDGLDQGRQPPAGQARCWRASSRPGSSTCARRSPQHQAKWRSTNIDEDPAGYRRATDELGRKQDDFYTWAKNVARRDSKRRAFANCALLASFTGASDDQQAPARSPEPAPPRRARLHEPVVGLRHAAEPRGGRQAARPRARPRLRPPRHRADLRRRPERGADRRDAQRAPQRVLPRLEVRHHRSTGRTAESIARPKRSSRRSRRACGCCRPTTSTSTTCTASTRKCRSRIRSARWRGRSRRARSAPMACPNGRSRHIREAHAVHPVGAVQTEYSLWTRNVELGVLETCRELGVALVAFSPLGRGALAGRAQGPRDARGQRPAGPRCRASSPTTGRTTWR